jgi:hypothetical protein
VDFENFGAFIAVNYSATIKIIVTDSGSFDIVVDHELKHETVNEHWKQQFLLERQTVDKSFKELKMFNGNFKDLIVDHDMLGEPVHEQYRNKKTIPIKPE